MAILTGSCYPANVEVFANTHHYTIDGARHLVAIKYPVTLTALFIDFTCQREFSPTGSRRQRSVIDQVNLNECRRTR